jgi:hypothetical protein
MAGMGYQCTGYRDGPREWPMGGVHMDTLKIFKCRELFFKGKHCVKCQIVINCCVSCVIFNKKKYNIACHPCVPLRGHAWPLLIYIILNINGGLCVEKMEHVSLFYPMTPSAAFELHSPSVEFS